MEMNYISLGNFLIDASDSGRGEDNIGNKYIFNESPYIKVTIHTGDSVRGEDNFGNKYIFNESPYIKVTIHTGDTRRGQHWK